MNFLSYLGGIPASAKEAVDVIAKGPAPSELELSLRQMHADHLAAMQAIKSLTEIAVSQTTRAVDQVAQLRELKRTITASEGKHFAAFELAQRPLLRAIEEIDKRLTDKLSKIDADLHAMRVDRRYELEAHTNVLNTKLNAVAERIDDLCKILAKDLIKHPVSVTVAPDPRKGGQGGPRSNSGRKPGSKARPLEVQYADVSNRLQRCRPNSLARKKYQFRLIELRHKLGMSKLEADK